MDNISDMINMVILCYISNDKYNKYNVYEQSYEFSKNGQNSQFTMKCTYNIIINQCIS